MRNFNVWVTAIGGIVLLFSMMMLFSATHAIRLAGESLSRPEIAGAHLNAALLSIKYGIMGIPFGAGLAIVGIVGRFKRYLDMLEAGAEETA